MKHSAFQTLFSLYEPSRLLKITGSVSHFFPRMSSTSVIDTFNVIIKATEVTGEVVCGQIPLFPLQRSLVERLAENSLVVSCVDHAELAGVGTLSSAIPTYIWSCHNIDHHHLPFTDNLCSIDPILVIETLQKMLAVHQNKGSIYIHCKPGSTSSALLSTLFKSTTDESIKKQLIAVQNVSEVEISVRTIFSKICPKTYLETAKLNLGVAVLKHYISYWKGLHKEKQLFDVPVDSKDKFNSYQVLSIIAQSDEYKFLWDQAYKNPVIFPVIKSFAEGIYDQVNQNPMHVLIIDELILSVINQLPNKDRLVIKDLHTLYLSYEHFSKEIAKYPQAVKVNGLNLLNKILKSNLNYGKKTWLLKISAEFLQNPITNRINYEKVLENSIKKPCIMLQAIGGSMMVLGAAVIMVSLVAGILASGGALAIIFATVGAAAFGAFETGIGMLVYNRGVSDGVTKASELLINQITSSPTSSPEGSEGTSHQ